MDIIVYIHTYVLDSCLVCVFNGAFCRSGEVVGSGEGETARGGPKEKGRGAGEEETGRRGETTPEERGREEENRRYMRAYVPLGFSVLYASTGRYSPEGCSTN